MNIPYDYEEAKELLGDIISGFEVLSGDKVSENADVETWQDQAAQVSFRCRQLMNRLEAAIEGNVMRGPVVFPSPNDLENGQ